MVRRVRALFFKPGEAEHCSSVWVHLDAGSPLTFVRLLHDYGADLAPVAGWIVEAAGKRYEVESASGSPRVLTCVERGA